MLERYDRILEGKEEPYYLKAKREGEDLSGKTLEELWEEHEAQLKVGVPSLELKKEIADRLLENCIFCERRCGVNRKEGEKGRCEVLNTKINSEFLHFGEERPLVPSHTVFFGGCNFECVFCQNWDISQRVQGEKLEPKTLAKILNSSGGKNINWVGGDPTPNISYILNVLSHLNICKPQIWNSNMYLSREGMLLLSKVMDVYLTDFKYGNDRCAERLSKVENYTQTIRRNHLIAERTGDLLIRHLVLPGHLECCTRPILEWIDSNLKDPTVNIMTQYRPVYKAEQYQKIDRYLNADEKRTVKELKRGYSHLTQDI